jgi:CHASE2 domain-containing sensor protein/predicted Ser/Thr protein kinase
VIRKRPTFKLLCEGLRDRSAALGRFWPNSSQPNSSRPNSTWRNVATGLGLTNLGNLKLTGLNLTQAQGRSGAILRVVLSSAIVTAGLVAAQELGLLQGLELSVFDQMVRLRAQPQPDPRLLVVTIDDDDLRRQQAAILSDETYANAFAQLQRHKPRAIGLDIYRDLPTPPGRDRLLKAFAAPNLIAIRKLPEANTPGTPPPPIAPEQIGFNDIIQDADKVVRRAFLFAEIQERGANGVTSSTQFSFAFRLASLYLSQQNIQPDNRPDRPDEIRWGKALLTPLGAESGGYARFDNGGYQMLIDYRRIGSIARTVSISQLLDGKVNPDWIRDKVVLVGTIALSANDQVPTPYSAFVREEVNMPGVLVHAQIVSQLLAMTLDGAGLRFVPWGVELLWIGAWALVGASIAWRYRRPVGLALSLILAGGILVVTTASLFSQSWWLPLISPLLALAIGGLSVIVYHNYRFSQEQQLLLERSAEQDQAILELKLSLARKPIVEEVQDQAAALSIGGMLVNRYRIEKILAAGGFGITYVASDLQRPGEPECVVKRLRTANNSPQFVEIARRLFKAEAEILEILGRHDLIPQLLAYFEAGDEFYLAEEFVRGEPLVDELPIDKRLSDRYVIDLLMGLLPVLKFIHDRHIIHRDVKPNNIIRRSDGALVLIDFGAVKQLQPDQQSQQTVVIGTHGYAPPEQLAGHPRISSDIYSLGIIAAQALTGIPPHMLEQHPETGNLIWQRFAKADPALVAIVDKMTQYHFRNRYDSAAAVLKDLAEL